MWNVQLFSVFVIFYFELLLSFLQWGRALGQVEVHWIVFFLLILYLWFQSKLLSKFLKYKILIQAEGLLAELDQLSCYDFVEQFCDFVLKHLSVMQKLRYAWLFSRRASLVLCKYFFVHIVCKQHDMIYRHSR